MKARIAELQDRIDSLSARERMLLFAGALALLYFMWDQAFMAPLLLQEKSLRARIMQKHGEQAGLTAQLQSLVTRQHSDPNEQNRRRLQELQTRLAKIEDQLRASTQHLVAPEKMAQILKTVMLKSKGLELLAVKGLGSSPIVTVSKEQQAAREKEAAAGTAGNSRLDNAYKHGLKIKFSGTFFSTLEYIRALESLDWGFFWDRLEFEITEYPDAVVSITVYTLSLDKNWIGA